MENNMIPKPAPVVPPNPSLKVKEPFTLKRSDNIFAVAAIVLGILLSVLGIFGGFAIGYAAVSVLLAVLFVCYFGAGGKIAATPIICGLVSFGTNAVFVLTSNGSVRFFAVIIGFLLALICLHGFIDGAPKGNRETVGVFVSSFLTLENTFLALRSLVDNVSGKKTFGKALVGFICAVPVLVVVVPLLLSSDAAFSGMMGNLFSNVFSTVIKSLFGIAISFLLITYGITKKSRRAVEKKGITLPEIESVYVVSFLTAISVCYMLYLFSQLAYFFSAFKGFLPDESITYAEYARRGFFEMCAIAVINLVLVFLSLLLSHKKENGATSVGVKALSTFISVFTLIIIATAISKMVLYIGAYGMTVLRLTTSAFMILLAVVVISAILKIYIKRINVIKTSLITAGCILIALGTLNVNAVCAKYNYEAYINGALPTIDVSAMYSLGDEGIPYLCLLTEDDDPLVIEEAEENLARAYYFRYFKGMKPYTAYAMEDLKKMQRWDGFESMTVPRIRAYDALYGFLEENPYFASHSYSMIYGD